ncbi:MAG TPA: NPCBM/NEW2 domain-containing protein [Phycisphaerae bacterium]|nr:NPCBM/NEW2 domain-containing protein [Phycisphaerae bacterium]HOJ53786.1 NPCBM/NEW2 domain-containing protein [Phycisphaerae bacterium]HOL27328.1 NPCBM/NEW2 domain-containing protein [Phycisphaerae bacterium]HPP21468.1 NPCBM/NEW2 domain-containing protein [Phycisphaerae bacterium]HPU31618.1 NPCBM/NEW2 domain-containing protein [Phycisphaerae bacterium]
MLSTIAAVTVFALLPLAQPGDAPGAVDYLSERPELIASSQQAWGELGINTCAHALDQKPEPMRIADKTFEKGLGHHASGEIIVDLDGQYETFLADVGVQPLPGGAGSVVFKVFVDDQLKFDSGVVKSGDAPRSLSVPVNGATEMRLEVTDAGDGIVCDCANWANARLVRSTSSKTTPLSARLDAAPFARVVTSDPARMTGCKAGRTEEYRAEDIYLEADLKADASGAYAVPFTPDGPGAIGLRWLEPRLLREVGIEFAAGSVPKSTDGVQIQYWAGESAWQGEWQPARAQLQVVGNRWSAELSWSNAPQMRKGTRRIRWILPATAGGAVVTRLIARTATPLDEVRLQIECDPMALGDDARSSAPAEIALYNGELISPTGRGTPPVVRWNYRSGEPLSLALRCARSRMRKSDRTVLHFRLPAGGQFGVAVDDVIAQGQVYVKNYGVYIARSPAQATLADYRRQIADRKTILEEVRHMPDQTFAQAIEHVHNPRQNLQPTLLSLACDNHKFVVLRDGLIQFAADQSKPEEMALSKPSSLAEMRPQFGTGKNEGLKRHLEGGWLPLPVNEVTENGIVYRQRTCVVPREEAPLPEPGWLSARPLCVAEFTIENTNDERTAVALNLFFRLHDKDKKLGLNGVRSNVWVMDGERAIGCVDVSLARPLTTSLMADGWIKIEGELSAGQMALVLVGLPGWTLNEKNPGPLVAGDDPFDRLKRYWQRVLARAAQITVPDPLLMNVIKASQVHCLMAARNEADGQRVAAWIASFSYGPLESEANSIIRGMDYLGHHEFARRAHDFFIHRYSPAGFLTTGYTLMGTGWQVWTLGQHYELTRDTEWLRKVAPDVARVCKWIMAQREKTKSAARSLPISGGRMGVSPAFTADGQKQPEYGLMPPGVMADWNAYAYHFCLNGYYYAALQAAAAALAHIDYPDTDTWLQNAAEFKRDILRAYRWTQARMPVYLLRDGTAVPAYPSQVHSPGPLNDFFPGEDANRSWCYDVELGPHHLVPLGVLDATSRDVTWMMDHHEDVQFLADGWFDYPAKRNHKDWFNLGGFAKVQPYYCRNAEVYALRDDVKPFIRSYFNTIPSLLGMENLQFQEHFAGVAAWNKTHETGYFLHQTRLMLVMERDKELWLAPFVTSNWMKDGATVAIRQAPTHFGPVSFRITSAVSRGTIEAEIEPPTRNAPEVIVLRLRHPEGKPMKAVTVNGADHKDFNPGREIVRIRPGKAKINVVASY